LAYTTLDRLYAVFFYIIVKKAPAETSVWKRQISHWLAKRFAHT